MLGMQMKGTVLVLAVTLSACGASTGSAVVRQAHHDTGAHHDTIRVVTTFSTLNSFVEGAGGKYVSVHNLVPVGASPETYQPTPQDIAKLADAQLLVENGTGIEVWLQHTIANAGNANLRTVVLSDGLRHIDRNPHLWMDPVLAQAYVGKIRDALIAIDPAHKVAYERNTAAYDAKLVALQAEIAKQIATIPAQQRTMIVFHNAWQYFNDRFGIRTVGVIELAPGQEPNPSYIGTLVDLARKYHVRAVFSEPEYSPKIAQTLAKSAGIRTVSDLYDDSISSNSKVHDYISMLRYDTNVIVQALK
ncbi:MAG TPA: metal ABC transporter substrate-binding protein [Candidatus Rubrimentiphilum sp.]|nr:metal ABC transporter substrate-binding protein [Candidatus Rubrimentiphilum sp.]